MDSYDSCAAISAQALCAAVNIAALKKRGRSQTITSADVRDTFINAGVEEEGAKEMTAFICGDKGALTWERLANLISADTVTIEDISADKTVSKGFIDKIRSDDPNLTKEPPLRGLSLDARP